MSNYLPTVSANTTGDVGKLVKKDVPASVAKSLPDSGEGWFFLVLVVVAAVAGGFAIMSVVYRRTSVTRTAP